jgi:hypothetical protein
MRSHPGYWTTLAPLDVILEAWDSDEYDELMPSVTTPEVSTLIIGPLDNGVFVGWADSMDWGSDLQEAIDAPIDY